MNTMTRETQPTRNFTSLRAAALADRIEEGARGLAAFAEGIPEKEWNTPVSGNGQTYGRRHRAPCRQRLSY